MVYLGLYHATWLVNSACHIWGYTNHRINDLSKNNWFVALITFGEGWHSNHHYNPKSAKTGLNWYEIDLTYFLVYSLQRLKLIDNVNI